MQFTVTDVPERERFEARDEAGVAAGVVTYQLTGTIIDTLRGPGCSSDDLIQRLSARFNGEEVTETLRELMALELVSDGSPLTPDIATKRVERTAINTVVLNVNTGARFETYAIEGQRGSRVVCLNGPAARLGQVGDIVIILTYALMDAEDAQAHTAKSVHVDANNNITTIDHAHDPN